MRTAIEAGEPGRRARDAIETTQHAVGREARFVRLDGRFVPARGRGRSRGVCGGVIRRRRRRRFGGSGGGGGGGSGGDRAGPYPHLASRWLAERGGTGDAPMCGGEVGLREPGGVPCVACRFYNRRGRTGEDRPRHRRSKPVNSNWRSSVLRDALSSLVSSHVSSYSEQSAIWKGPIQRDKTDLAWLAVLFHSFIHS